MRERGGEQSTVADKQQECGYDPMVTHMSSNNSVDCISSSSNNVNKVKVRIQYSIK
jgi:hypothetical protein